MKRFISLLFILQLALLASAEDKGSFTFRMVCIDTNLEFAFPKGDGYYISINSKGERFAIGYLPTGGGGKYVCDKVEFIDSIDSLTLEGINFYSHHYRLSVMKPGCMIFSIKDEESQRWIPQATFRYGEDNSIRFDSNYQGLYNACKTNASNSSSPATVTPKSPFVMNGVVYYYNKNGYYQVGDGIHPGSGIDKNTKDKKQISINKKIFATWDNGTNKDIPVKEIAADAFANCTGIESVIIFGVQTVNSRAFANCRDLKEIDFRSEGTKKICKDAFRGCYKVTNVIFNLKQPPLWEGYTTAFGLPSRNKSSIRITLPFYTDKEEVEKAARFKKAWPFWQKNIFMKDYVGGVG